MSQSHMPVRHLIRQVEIHRSKRTARPTRDIRPGWVTELIDAAAELFDPHTDTGRVGFDCRFDDDRWSVSMFLGGTEVVGGADDGCVVPPGFQFNLQRLRACFDELEGLFWEVDANAAPLIRAEGVLDGNPVVLLLHSLPPTELGPAFRTYPDGRCEVVD